MINDVGVRRIASPDDCISCTGAQVHWRLVAEPGRRVSVLHGLRAKMQCSSSSISNESTISTSVVLTSIGMQRK